MNLTRARQTAVHFCKVAGCQNLLFGKQTDYCHDQHRTEYHTRAREIGYAVIDTLGYPEAIRIRTGVRLTVRKPRIELYDLDRLQPQERLGALCRAAERQGVLT
jgi:hypothetical protein